MGEVSGFSVRPGLFDVNGAMALPNGVNFTIHTHNGTSCELLLFHKDEEEPFAILPFPESYKIGDVYSMIVFDLDIDTFDYAYRVDGPYCPEEGLLFNRRNILLDPYAMAVTGQDSWGKRKRRPIMREWSKTSLTGGTCLSPPRRCATWLFMNCM